MSGIGRVDVFTPNAIKPSSIARAIEKKVKGNQAESFIVAVPSETRLITMLHAARASFKKSKGVGEQINKIFFLQNGKLTEVNRSMLDQIFPKR